MRAAIWILVGIWRKKLEEDPIVGVWRPVQSWLSLHMDLMDEINPAIPWCTRQWKPPGEVCEETRQNFT
jgi:hypothetical protein